MPSSTLNKPEMKATDFTCHAPAAHQVRLAGNFNGWSTTATPLKKSRDGNWKVRLQLLPGRYEFKFLVDDVWCCDPAVMARTRAARTASRTRMGQ